jgi:hypothetical protein
MSVPLPGGARPGANRYTPQLWTLAAFIALFLGVAAVAAARYERLGDRVARYTHDPSCAATTLARPPAWPRALNAGGCQVAPAHILDRRVYAHTHGGRDYVLTLRTDSGRRETVYLKGSSNAAVWSAARPGSEIIVQRFADPSPDGGTHTTLVRAGGPVATTSWNPEWESTDSLGGAVIFGIVALVCGIAFRVTQRKGAA